MRLICCISLFLFFVMPTAASQISAQALYFDCEQLSEEINREPWKAYQQLIQSESSFEQFDKPGQLRYLVCKAQAENLLYFYDQFNNTINRAQLLLDNKTALDVSSKISYFQGLIYQRNGEYKLSVASFEKAMSLTLDTEYDTIHVLALQELAYTNSLTGLYVASFTKIREAFVKASKLKDEFLLATIYENYGAIYGFLGDYELSIKNYESALERYRKLKFRPYEAEAIYGIASTYRYWGKFKEAKNFFEKYIEKTSYTPNDDVTFFGLYGLGMTLAEKGNCIEAVTYVNKALLLDGAEDYKAELYKRQASCFVKLNKIKEAQESVSKAESIFELLPELLDTKWSLETIKIRGEIAQAVGDHKLAYQLVTSYYERYNNLLTESTSERLSSLRSNYELETKDGKIELLQQQAKVQQLEADQHIRNAEVQKFQLAFALFIIFVFLVAIMLQRRYTKKIIAISIRDSLSGLYNRRYLFKLFDNLIKSLANRKAELSIILLDIDDFKFINDQYGHPFGDTVIKKVAEICQSTLRIEDAMGRIGGEEYLCLLPRIGKEQCIAIANRMLESVSAHIFTTETGTQFNITISIGIASSSVKAKTRRDILIHADKALYDSKDSGKNKVSCYEEL